MSDDTLLKPIRDSFGNVRWYEPVAPHAAAAPGGLSVPYGINHAPPAPPGVTTVIAYVTRDELTRALAEQRATLLAEFTLTLERRLAEIGADPMRLAK